MLRPEERQHLLELLRPPVGCTLDVAVGTTYSLDLISALMLLLSCCHSLSSTGNTRTANWLPIRRPCCKH